VNLRLKPAAISYTIKRQRRLLLLSLSFARKADCGRPEPDFCFCKEAPTVMAKKGINSTHSIYYGRRRGFKRRLTIFLLVLLLILMALAAGFFYLQEFIVYTADGFRFDFPFLQPNNQPTQEPELPEEIPLITGDGDEEAKTDSSDGESPDQQPEEQPPVQSMAGHWAAGELAQVADPAYRARLIEWAQQADCDTLVFTVKTPNGQVLIPTDSAIAAQVGSVNADPAVVEGLAALKAEGFHLAARLSANRDNIAPRALRANMVATYNGVTWMDYDYLTWMAPSGPDTAEYLGQLAVSCKQLGFEGLLLADLGYPTRGKTNIVGTDRQGDRAALTAQMIQNLRGYADGLFIAAELTDTAAAQLIDAEAGQDVIQLAAVCDWLTAPVPFAEDPSVAPLRQTIEAQQSDCRLMLSLPADMLPADKSFDYYLR